MNVTPTFLYPIFGLETTTTCPGCGLGTNLREHNFVVVPRFTTRELICNNLLLYESDVMQGGGYVVSISLVVQSMVAQVWRPGHV